MAIYKGKNFVFQDPPCENGDEFHECNLMQKLPNTSICVGKTGLKFVNCNITNCVLPGDADTGGRIAVQRSFCYHLHPNWDLTPEVENCPHVVETDEVYIDGQLVGTIYHRQDTRLN